MGLKWLEWLRKLAAIAQNGLASRLSQFEAAAVGMGQRDFRQSGASESVVYRAGQLFVTGFRRDLFAALRAIGAACIAARQGKGCKAGQHAGAGFRFEQG